MTSVAVRDPWKVVPSLGNLDAYIDAVNKFPMLTAERELELSRKHREEGDISAAHELVLSHLRLVVSTARPFDGYGLPFADLIQEGNIGLMKAVKNFDSSHGARLGTYAIYWIKNEMHEYIIKNWRMIKIATTKAQRKLFWNLRTLTKDQQGKSLTNEEVDSIAEKLNVKPSEVREMEMRFRGYEMQIHADDDEEDDQMAPMNWIPAEGTDPESILDRQAEDEMLFSHLPDAMVVLNEREREIITKRWFTDDVTTLQELGTAYGVSAERIRQIETAALKKLREALQQVEYL